MKRLAAPGFWPIEKKTKKFVVRPRPGPHNSRECIPLGVVVRDILKHARTMKEVKQILNAGHVKVDGRIRKSGGFVVGLMDTISVGDESYRVLPDSKGLHLQKITRGEAGTKLLRVNNKRTIKNGKTQLNLHDGSNILYDGDVKTKDVIVLDVEQRKVKNVIKFVPGSTVLITGGNNRGETGKMEKMIIVKNSMTNYVVVSTGEKKIALPESYIFVVGASEPIIKLSQDGDKA